MESGMVNPYLDNNQAEIIVYGYRMQIIIIIISNATTRIRICYGKYQPHLQMDKSYCCCLVVPPYSIHLLGADMSEKLAMPTKTAKCQKTPGQLGTGATR